jgi:DNA invertase Pin-like site-specific DNA recombinase
MAPKQSVRGVLLDRMARIMKAGAGFCTLTEKIDTITPAGRMIVQMVGSFAELERAMIRERTSAGLAAARAEGRHHRSGSRDLQRVGRHLFPGVEAGQYRLDARKPARASPHVRLSNPCSGRRSRRHPCFKTVKR